MDSTKKASLLEAISRQRVLVIGDVILDHYIWGDVDRISPEAPVPVVEVERESDRLGGAANVALNLAALGVRTSLLGRFGDDSFAERLTGLISNSGIQLVDTVPFSAAGTIVKTRVVARHQQLCRLDREGHGLEYALGREVWEEVLPPLVAEHGGVLVSDYAKGLIDADFLDVLRSVCRVQAKPVFVDPKPIPERDLSQFELLTPNRVEALRMSGVRASLRQPFPIEEVVRRIHERFGPRYLVVTLGAEGMMFAENGKIGDVLPTFAREVYDVSGAGDTVIALLSSALLAGASLSEAVMLANTAAGVVVGKLGTACVSAEEILIAPEPPC
jgi:D-beta-D-heptose 7-phosphate kinase/D-beta-D-heptose 1-phosphate adenosyltransferase